MATPKPSPKPSNAQDKVFELAANATKKGSGVTVTPTTPGVDKVFELAKNGGKLPAAKSSKPKTPAADPWAPVASFGQRAIDAMSATGYGITGAINESMNIAGMKPEEFNKKYGSPIGIIEMLGQVAGASNKNATTFATGGQAITTVDILRNKLSPIKVAEGSPEEYWLSLAGDIALDPLTYVPGGVLLTGVKGGLIAAKTALKAGKIAATTGKVSERVAFGAAKTVAEKRAVVEGAQALKPGANVIDQYTRKPLIKENLRRQEGPVGNIFKQLQSSVGRDYAYKVSPLTTGARVTLGQILGSSLEAGAKAGASTVLTEMAKRSMEKVVKIEAKAAKKLANTLPAVASAAAKAVTPGEVSGAAPILDTALETVTPKVLAATKAPTEFAKGAQKMLSQLESLATKTTGKTAGDDVAGKVVKALEKESEVSKFAANLRPDVINKIKTAVSDKADILNTIVRFSTAGPNTQEYSVAKLMVSKPIISNTGRKTQMLELINSGKSLSEFSPSIRQQVTDHFTSLLGPTGAKLTELNSLVGPDMLDKILKTNVLDATKETKTDVLKKLIAGLPKGGESVTKTYGSFAEVVAGLKAGDRIDYNVVEKMMKIIDPESVAIKAVDKALSKDEAHERMTNLLVTKGAQTVYDTERRLGLLNSETLFKAQGLSLADVISTYVNGRLDGSTIPSPSAVDASRGIASANVDRWMRSIPDVQKVLKDSLWAINAGLGGTLKPGDVSGQFAFIEKITAQQDILDVTSTFGDVALKSKTLGKAALPNQFNQSFEARMFANLAGIARTRKIAPEARLDDMIMRYEMVRDGLLSTTGGRIVHSKAYQAGETKHYVFVDMGDFMSVLKQAGKGDLAVRALIPDATLAGIEKTDALSTMGIGKAIRMVMEANERGIEIDSKFMAELKTAIKSRGEGQTKWSATFKTKVDGLANEIADFITDPETVKKFSDIHTQRAVASVEDVMASAESMSRDLFESMYKGWQINAGKNIDSTAARAQLARDWFNKFVYASGIFKQQSGEIAESVFQAAAMVFMQGGKLKALAGEAAVPLVGSPNARDEVARSIYEESVKEIQSLFKYQNGVDLPNAGLEKVAKPRAATIAKAQDALTEAQLAYEKHANDALGLTDPEDLKTWEQTYYKLQAGLDVARKTAQKYSIATRHWQNGKWVPSSSYDRAAALGELEATGQRFIATGKGMIDRSKNLDSAFEPIKGHKMTAEQKNAWMKAWREGNAVRGLDAAKGVAEEQAQKIIDNLPEYENLGLTPGELGQRLFQEETAKVYDNAQIKVLRGTTTYTKARSALQANEVAPRGLAKLGERFSANSGRWNLRPLLSRAESTTMTTIGNIADVAHELRINYKALLGNRPEAFAEAFRLAMSRVDIPENTEAAVASLATDLRAILDPLFGNPETSDIVASGIDPASLAAAFRKFGLTEEAGFVSPSTLTPKQLADYTKTLPFGDIPEHIKGTIEEAAYVKRAEEFASKGIDPFIMVTRLAQAVQFAKTERAFVMDFAQNFSYKSQGLTFEQAMKQGWVKIEGISGGSGTDLSKFLPKPEAGGLFPPNIAEEFLSLNREWNKIYNSGGMPAFVRTAMDITGFLKATQTIFRLGHHVTNMVGDTTTAMIYGVRNPVHWKQGMELALSFAGQDARATWGKNKLDNKFVELFKSYSGYGRAWEGTSKTGASVPSVALVRNGKAVKVNLSNEELLQAFKERGIIIGNIFQNDIQGLYESVIGDVAALGAQKTLREVAGAKLKVAAGKIEQGPGAFASYYGNIPRAAHAMKVIQSRSWNSIDEALMAAQDAVNRAHPSIQSLSAGERRGPRLIFTYYTWLRVAHNALIDMAINHTGAMLVPSKIQYNQAVQAGLDPSSYGNPWGEEINAPNYLTYSVYGPTEVGVNGPVMYKRSILPMDVLDTWNLSYDPAYTADQNAAMIKERLGKTVGGMLNPFIQTAIETVDPTFTGRSAKDKVVDLPTFADSLLAKTGFYNLAKGTGAYKPPTLKPGEENTKEYKDNQARIMRNWATGQKETFINTEGNLKNYYTELQKRMKASYENQQGK